MGGGGESEREGRGRDIQWGIVRERETEREEVIYRVRERERDNNCADTHRQTDRRKPGLAHALCYI